MKELFSKRSVRAFQPTAIEPDKIEIILKAAMCAPTTGSQNEREFIVVTEKELLKKLADVSPYTACVADAPLAIVLLANFDKVEFPELWEQDMAAATEKILLECVHLDMSGTWLGISPVAERMENVCKIFALPENIVPFAITAIGYPLQKTSMDRDFDFSIVHYNEFKKA
ncbi:MAG: nitroreductase family protein [Oscillospiraceae bacterium]